MITLSGVFVQWEGNDSFEQARGWLHYPWLSGNIQYNKNKKLKKYIIIYKILTISSENRKMLFDQTTFIQGARRCKTNTERTRDFSSNFGPFSILSSNGLEIDFKGGSYIFIMGYIMSKSYKSKTALIASRWTLIVKLSNGYNY